MRSEENEYVKIKPFWLRVILGIIICIADLYVHYYIYEYKVIQNHKPVSSIILDYLIWDFATLFGFLKSRYLANFSIIKFSFLLLIFVSPIIYFFYFLLQITFSENDMTLDLGLIVLKDELVKLISGTIDLGIILLAGYIIYNYFYALIKHRAK